MDACFDSAIRRSEGHKIQTNCRGEFPLPAIRADEFTRRQSLRRGTMQHIQRPAADGSGMLLRQLHRRRKSIFPIDAGRDKHAGLQICFNQGTRRRHLGGSRVLQENLQLKSVHKLQLVQRRVTNRLALNECDDFRAIWFRVVEFDETARVQVGHDTPPRACPTTSLSGWPGGCSPHTALARARKSGCGAGEAGRTLATTLFCSVTCTSSPAATHRRISGHCCGNC